MALAVCGIAATASAAPNYGSAPEYVSLSKSFQVTSIATADYDEDAGDEVAIAYRTRGKGAAEGGVLVLKPRGEEHRPVFHVFFENTYASELKGEKGKLTLILVKSSPGGEQERQLQWTYGKEFVFNEDERSPMKKVRATSSSRARKGGIASENVIDGDLGTAWAEGVDGTGIGESVTVKLPRPMSIGLVGILAGKSLKRRDFNLANRIHRATLEVQTEGDVGDVASELDFSDLGIDFGGDTEELTFANEPEVKFFVVKRRRALNVVLRIDSVFLGDKEDDTYVAEIEVVPMLPPAETLDKATAYKRSKGAPTVEAKVISSE